MEGSGGGAALSRLLAANAQFVTEFGRSVPAEQRASVLSTAHPSAVVLGCSDSRVPPEIVLGQDIGDLFVVRVAGNIAGSEEVGTIEYALGRWRLPLVLVLGHTECGAVAAVLDPSPVAVESSPELAGSPHLASLLVGVRSNVAFARYGSGGTNGAPADRWRLAVEANVRQVVLALPGRSQLMRARIASGELLVAGAIYDVQTGRIEPIPAL